MFSYLGKIFLHLTRYFIYCWIENLSEHPLSMLRKPDTLNKTECGIMVIVVGNGHGNTSSNPGRDWSHFT